MFQNIKSWKNWVIVKNMDIISNKLEFCNENIDKDNASIIFKGL
jgi:hypothetical protein